jgi:hypothetical protein
MGDKSRAESTREDSGERVERDVVLLEQLGRGPRGSEHGVVAFGLDRDPVVALDEELRRSIRRSQRWGAERPEVLGHPLECLSRSDVAAQHDSNRRVMGSEPSSHFPDRHVFEG